MHFDYSHGGSRDRKRGWDVQKWRKRVEISLSASLSISVTLDTLWEWSTLDSFDMKGKYYVQTFFFLRLSPVAIPTSVE